MWGKLEAYSLRDFVMQLRVKGQLFSSPSTKNGINDLALFKASKLQL